MSDSTAIHRNETETFGRTKDDGQPKLGVLGWDDGTDTTVASVSSSTTTKRSNISSGKRGKMSSGQKVLTLDDFINGLEKYELVFYCAKPEKFVEQVALCVSNEDYTIAEMKRRLQQEAARLNIHGPTTCQGVGAVTQEDRGPARPGDRSTRSHTDSTISSPNQSLSTSTAGRVVAAVDDSSATGLQDEFIIQTTHLHADDRTVEAERSKNSHESLPPIGEITLQEPTNAASHLCATHSASAPTAPIPAQADTAANDQEDDDTDKSSNDGERKISAA